MSRHQSKLKIGHRQQLLALNSSNIMAEAQHVPDWLLRAEPRPAQKSSPVLKWRKEETRRRIELKFICVRDSVEASRVCDIVVEKNINFCSAEIRKSNRREEENFRGNRIELLVIYESESNWIQSNSSVGELFYCTSIYLLWTDEVNPKNPQDSSSSAKWICCSVETIFIRKSLNWEIHFVSLSDSVLSV